MNMPRAHLLIVVAALLAAVIGFLVFRDAPPPAHQAVTLLPEPRPLPAFALVDQHGAPIDEQALTGRWHLVFFGFTHCPDICPMTLQTLAAVRGRFDGEGSRQPGVVFVSIDPARDGPEMLGDYLAYYDPDIIGITGAEDAVAEFARAMGVAVVMGEADAQGHYNVDHTTAVFLLDPKGRLAGLFRIPHRVDAMAQDLGRLIGSRG
ncbi:MAG: SCO family protein [Gammaproteobacteria bacterium]|nr:SCO family protein [Gammaproteobacteria bacterium]